MLSPRVNSKGLLAGYISGLINGAIIIIGMFIIERDPSFYNNTNRNADYCDVEGLISKKKKKVDNKV